MAEDSIRPADITRRAGTPRCPRTHARTYCTKTWEVSMSSRRRGGVAKERMNPLPMMNGIEKSTPAVVAVKPTTPVGHPGVSSRR